MAMTRRSPCSVIRQLSTAACGSKLKVASGLVALTKIRQDDVPAQRKPACIEQPIDRIGQGADMNNRIRIEPDTQNFPYIARMIGVPLARPALMKHPKLS
jgi:hypothetical protein